MLLHWELWSVHRLRIVSRSNNLLLHLGERLRLLNLLGLLDFILIDLLLKILELLKLLLFWIKNILLVENSVTELIMIHCIRQKSLYSILNYRHL